MARRRAQRRRNQDPDESTGLAGWLYTDLLLGLAVVFLGSAAFLVPKPEEPAKPRPPGSTSAVPTTTLKKVKLCQSLYAAAGEVEAGIYVVLPASLAGEQLRIEFERRLREELDQENQKPQVQAEGALSFEGLRLGYVRALAGGQNNKEFAERLLERLSVLFPLEFEGTPLRAGWTNSVAAGQVGLEILPYVSRPCKKN
jgi:hypothetical protein